jgi:NTE family protein
MNITLALSGGGIKGFAHIGSIKVLEAEGFHIRGVAGSSAGGLVGALYAAGYSPGEMEARLREIDQGSLFTRVHGDGPALLGFAGVTATLTELLGDREFMDLRIPLAITATNLTTGLPVVIQHGRLIDACIATSAVPGIFPPVSMHGHILVDGAVMNPIPVAEARALYPSGPVVAIILSPPLGWQQEAAIEAAGINPFPMTNIPLLFRLAGRLRLAQAFNIFMQSIDIATLVMIDNQLKLEQPEVIIRPEVGHIGIMERVDIPKVIRSGELAAQKALPELRRAISWQYQFRRRVSKFISPG